MHAWGGINPEFEVEAKERERIGGKIKGTAKLPEAQKGQAREKVADLVGVSPHSMSTSTTSKDLCQLAELGKTLMGNFRNLPLFGNFPSTPFLWWHQLPDPAGC
jgi:hypothetical protein